MEWDHLAEEQSQKLFAGWIALLFKKSPELPLELAEKHRAGFGATEASSFTTGSYNVCCTVTFEDGHRVLVRFPILGRSQFRCEKTNDELLVMAYVARRTKIPMPKVLGTGHWGCGPYVVMEIVEGTLLSQCLPSINISDPNLERAYSGMAQVILELSKLTFPRIGALQWESFNWKVDKRPMTLNMNELVRVSNLPPTEFPENSYQTASAYFQELARQQFLHLKYQRNDAVKDESDCKKKYIARCLFRKIASKVATMNSGPFRLYCDDFRPANVFVSESDFTVKGVIDWEFTYIAPAEFIYTAPWWLLFESPEAWESDLKRFLERYMPRLQLFLKALRTLEDDEMQKGTLSECLSDRMEQSMGNGLFWFCLAARKSFMFDDIYWTFLHEKYYGKFASVDNLLPLLSVDERTELDGFVRMKMAQATEMGLDEHMTFDEIVDL